MKLIIEVQADRDGVHCGSCAYCTRTGRSAPCRLFPDAKGQSRIIQVINGEPIRNSDCILAEVAAAGVKI